MTLTTPLNLATRKLRTETNFLELQSFHNCQPFTYSTVDTIGKHVMTHSGDKMAGGKKMLNVSSALYLSLADRPELIDAVNETNKNFGTISGASRLSYKVSQEEFLEEDISKLMGTESTLLFQTTSLASLGVVTAMCHTKDDVIIFDQYAHRTLQKAIQLARASGVTTIKIPHNDVNKLEELLSQTSIEKKGNILIAVDGVYSMSGNTNDLLLFDELARKYGAFLYIDDAHGFAVMGEGRGVVGHFGLPMDNILYVGGFSKSFGGFGSFVCCNQELAEYIKMMAYTYNFAGPIQSGAYTFNIKALEILKDEGEEMRRHLFSLSKFLIDELRGIGYTVSNQTNFPIICPIIGDEQLMEDIAKDFYEKNIMILPVCYPVVPRNQSLIRLTPNVAHNMEDMERVIEVFRDSYDPSRVYKEPLPHLCPKNYDNNSAYKKPSAHLNIV